MRKVGLWVLGVLLLASESYAQEFRFKRYSTEDGISQNFIYSIDQDKNGYLWVGTGEGLCRFDGKNFTNFLTEDGLAEDVITSSFMDSKGGLWFGHNGGGVSMYDGREFTTLEGKVSSNSLVTGFIEANGYVWFGTQNDGLFRVNESYEVSSYTGELRDKMLFSLAGNGKGQALVGTNEGLYIFVLDEAGTVTFKSTVPGLEEKQVQAISEGSSGTYWLGTQANGVYQLKQNKGKYVATQIDTSFHLQKYDVQSLFEDELGNLWGCTFGNGAFKLLWNKGKRTFTEITWFNESNGLGNSFAKTAFQDREGNVWMGTFGGGLATLMDDFFIFYGLERSVGQSADVRSVYVKGLEEVWMGLDKGLLLKNQRLGTEKIYNKEAGFIDGMVTALHRTSDNRLWVGTANQGIWEMDIAAEKFKKIKMLQAGSVLDNYIHQIQGDSALLWAATKGGLFAYYPLTGESIHLTTSDGLPHNSIKSIYLDRKERLWIGTHSNSLFSIADGVLEEHPITNAGGIIEVLAINGDDHDNIWVATSEWGVYEYTEGGKFVNYSTADGLASEYCYSMHPDANGNMWVGHRGALSKIDLKKQKVIAYGKKQGIKAQVNPNAMHLDDRGYLWIGTREGAIKYDPTKDKQNAVPPMTNMVSITIADKKIDFVNGVELPYGKYRIEFEFVGVSFKDPEQVYYKYILEGFDQQMSQSGTLNKAVYGKVEDGDFIFKVSACNADGICNPVFVEVNVKVARPFWKRWWFYVLVAFAITAIVFYILRKRVEQFRKIQDYLQTELTKKTKELVKQKEVVEEINQDLTDSINYAQGIQKAMLSEEEILRTHLPESFIFFRPKDIVSGDFYWFNKLDHRVIVVCADCTGHGVPGAFMSMLGAVTLRNIYRPRSDGDYVKPNEALTMLDAEVNSILKQSKEIAMGKHTFHQSKDGMDLALCEIDIKTNKVTVSSAMRNFLIYQNKELVSHRGDRFAIGGGSDEQKVFTNQEFQMSKGDAIYMFSDGYPDQFGGEKGKKLKMSRLKQIVLNNAEKTIEEQEINIKNNFLLWKEGYDQIDDVLFIGVRF